MAGRPQTKTGWPPVFFVLRHGAGGPQARLTGHRPCVPTSSRAPSPMRRASADWLREAEPSGDDDAGRASRGPVSFSSPFCARALQMAAGRCGTPLDRAAAKVQQLRRYAGSCGAGATGLEPATSGVTGDPTVFGRIAEAEERPAQRGIPGRWRWKPNRASEGGFRAAWTRCGRADRGSW